MNNYLQSDYNLTSYKCISLNHTTELLLTAIAESHCSVISRAGASSPNPHPILLSSRESDLTLLITVSTFLKSSSFPSNKQRLNLSRDFN